MRHRTRTTDPLVALGALLALAGCSTGASSTSPLISAGSGGGGNVAGFGAGGAGAAGAAGVSGAPAMPPPQAGAAGGQAGSAGQASPTADAGAPTPGATPDAGAPSPDSGGGALDAGPVAPDPEAGDCENADPLEVLRALAPDDEDLASDYEQYLQDEIETVECATQGSGGARTITRTLFVPPGAVYEGRGEQLTADVAAMRCDTSEGEQAEAQKPYFLLAPGAQLKNVTIRYPGCEGIHMMGDNVLENIVWEDAGEDAASVRSYFPGGRILIKDSEGHHAADKMFQFNAPCDVRIESFVGSDMGKLVRQNGGTEFELRVDLNTVTVTGVVSAVVQSDSPLCFVRHHALSYQFTGSGDKSDRVFRDIPPENVTEY